MLIDLLNQRITPVVQSRGTLGEGDLAQLSNVGATMVGAGDAYYQGTRMPAAEALAKAGLKPIQPFRRRHQCADQQRCVRHRHCGAAVDDAERALEWADLIYAMDLNGMNSSITPLSTLVQRERPFKWLNWDAARVRDMIKGSYLFSDDPHRIIQDPESLRASSIRQASAWQDWGALRDAVVLQMNSSDHNPGRAHRPVAAGFLGPVHPANDEVLRQGRQVQQRQARLHRVERELGPVSDGEQARGFHHRAGEHGHRGVAAHRSVLQSVLHADQSGPGAAHVRRATVSRSIWPAAAGSPRWI